MVPYCISSIIISLLLTLMKNNRLPIVFLFVLPLLASCTQKLYFPDRANTPGLTRPLEGKVTISLKPQHMYRDSLVDGVNFGWGADAAFSPVNHLGFIVSYRNINNKKVGNGEENVLDNNPQSEGTYNGSRFELGLGFYEKFGRRGKVEIYGGYGNGSLRRTNSARPDLEYNTRYHRFFIQPAVGLGKNDRFSMTMGIRLAIMKYYSFDAANPLLRYDISGDDHSVTQILYPYIEPFLNFEAGYKYIKGNVQMGLSRELTADDLIVNPYVSFGLVFHFLPVFD